MKKQKTKEQELTKKQKIKSKAKASAKKFKGELKKSLLVAITAAFGFLMALTWKDLISEVVNNVSSVSPLQGRIIETITITLIAVLGILIVTKILEEKSEE